MMTADQIKAAIDPNGRAVGGPQPVEMKLLHVYSQPCEHFEAQIVGNYTGLLELERTIHSVLKERLLSLTTGEVFATDGEGYQVIVHLFPDDWNDPAWVRSPPHYCDRGYEDDTHREEVK